MRIFKTALLCCCKQKLTNMKIKFSRKEFVLKKLLANCSHLAANRVECRFGRPCIVAAKCSCMTRHNVLLPSLHFQVYGLNFSSKDDADVFATAMIKALEVRTAVLRIRIIIIWIRGNILVTWIRILPRLKLTVTA